MTSQSPRIYIYKITFEEVLYYYYGVKKEDSYNQEYWGSPYTHKWMWDFYTPKKQILEVFPHTDEGWEEANKVEKRIIKQFYNGDRWCLNEHCGGQFSMETLKKGSEKNKNNKTGIFSLSKEELSFYGSIGGNKNKINKTGFFNLTKEERIEIGRKAGSIGGKKSIDNQRKNKTGFFNSELQSELGKRGGTKTKELGVGIFAISHEEKSKLSREIGLRMRDEKKGIFSLTKEQLRENSLKNKEKGLGIFSLTKEQISANNKKNGENTGKQRWICLETGYITTPGPLTLYQRAKGIDTSKRERIQ